MTSAVGEDPTRGKLSAMFYRCARHNRVMKRLDVNLRRKALRTWVEPIIPTVHSFIKPDVVMEKGHSTYIMDESWCIKNLTLIFKDNVSLN